LVIKSRPESNFSFPLAISQRFYQFALNKILMKHSILVLLLLFSLISHSQISHSISLGPELAVPGKHMSGANIGFGGSLVYLFQFSERIGIHLHGGYNQFTGKSGGSSKIDFLSARAGLTGFIFEDVIFAFADVGTTSYHSKYTGSKENGISVGVGGGCRFLTGDHQFMQLSISYNPSSIHFDQLGQSYNNRYDWLTIKAAFGLLFKKGKN
jgi:hypothetical protein